MRGLTHRWVLPEAGGGEALVGRVLRARGLVAEEAREAFLEPSLKRLHEPSAMADMDRACERILAAARGGEPIVIFGDYDVDGITATMILHRMLKALEARAEVRTFIPHRDEGYGLSVEAIESLASEGARLIVSVDCGITAIEPARAAKALGVDLIVTDHHNPPASEGDLPEAYAVVHPRRPASAYPFGGLCGAGVAYKVAWRLATMHAGTARVSEQMRSLLVELLAPAAMGAIADIVPLVDENRVIAKFGMSRVASSRFVGIRALVEASGIDDGRVDSEVVGFRLAPRINACGRMGHAREALQLLLTDDEAEARSIAEVLNKANESRRRVEKQVVEEASRLAEAMGIEGRRSIVLAKEGWARGVLGLAASRLAERYCRPTALLRLEDGMGHGSARSIDGFNLHAALEACGAHLCTYGGHDAAAGLSCEEGRVEGFAAAFEAHASGVLSEEDLVHTLRIDADATPGELSLDSVGQIERLAPFGAGNARVTVRCARVRVHGPVQAMGRDGSHLKVTFEGDDGVMRVVAWGWAKHAEALAPGRLMDVAVSPRISRWNGSARVEGELVDVCVGRTDGMTVAAR